MLLQEQISRIQEMMGINLHKKIGVIQKLINSSILSLKHKCETLNDDDNEYVSFGACDLIDSNLKVYLKEIKKENDVLTMFVDMTYENYGYMDEDSFVIELQLELNNFIGKNKVVVHEYTNKFPEEKRQW